MCGEKWRQTAEFLSRWGSPPRVRGKGNLHGYHDGGSGITPACAGKSKRLMMGMVSIWDHPRVCGEKPCSPCMPCGPGGSPPRVRGKASRPSQYLSAYRITPACAGKRRCSAPNASIAEDHPRVCGEKTKKSP